MFKSKSTLFLFGLEILAMALYLWHQSVSAFMGWEYGWPYLQILFLAASTALLTAGLYKLFQHVARILSARTDMQPTELFAAFVLALSPFLFLFLIFLQYFVFLKDIRGYLLPVSFAGSVFLVYIFLSRLRRTYPQAIDTPKIIKTLSPNQISSKRLGWFVFILALLVYIIYATGLILPSQPLTGDEPHYLLTTKSIVQDGDINVYNNYRYKDYSNFYPGELSTHAYSGKKGDNYLYSKHFIALSALMVPSYALGEKIVRLNTNWSGNPETKRRILVFFARLPVCLITALLSLVFFLLVLDITRRKDISVFTWAVFSFTSPVLFFSHLLYPAIPVALLAIIVFRYSVLKKEPSPPELIVSGVAIGLMPWFGIKFIVLSAVLFGASFLNLLTHRKGGNFWKKAVLFLLPIAVSAGFYLLYFWVIYGSYSPVSAYTGVTPEGGPPAFAKRLLLFSIFEILGRGLGFFIDQKYGFLIYSPLYILGFAGLYFYFRRKRREASILTVVLAVPWIFSANYYWGGYCPPGRPIIPVLWIWGLFLAIALAERQSRFQKMIAAVGLGLSLAMTWAALRDPWILYHEQYASEMGGEFLYSKLARSLSNTFVQFHNMMPSLKELDVFNWLTLVIWILAICTIVVVYVRKNEAEKPQALTLKMTGRLCLVFLVSSLFLTYVFFDIHFDDKAAFAQQNYALYFQDDNHFGKEVGGFWTKGKRKVSVILESPQPPSAIQVTLTSSVGGTTSVQIGSSKKTLKREKSTGFRESATFSPIIGFPMHEGHLYTITIEDSSGFVPYQLDRNVKDNRYLGVFVQIKTAQ